MAQDYVKLDNDQEYGMIAINKSVFESIADISIDEIDNAVRLKNRFSHPISVKIDKGKLSITAEIKVKYGATVNATAELLQNKIYENILFMTGYKAADVTVNVEGFEI
jgi:uncharacterized alkaline shock family protein YloU